MATLFQTGVSSPGNQHATLECHSVVRSSIPLGDGYHHPVLWLFCKVGGSEFLGVGKGSAFGIIDSRIRFEAPLRLVQ